MAEENKLMRAESLATNGKVVLKKLVERAILDDTKAVVKLLFPRLSLILISLMYSFLVQITKKLRNPMKLI